MKTATAIPLLNMVSRSRGLYARVARKMGCDPSYVSRIARNERRSARVEAALGREIGTFLTRLEDSLKFLRKTLQQNKNRGKQTKNP
jgi:transcriptional regulator with XRE-family HTH domain